MTLTPDGSANSPTAGGGRSAAPAQGEPILLIAALGRQVRAELEVALAPLGLTMRHLGALGHLSRNPEASISELARRAGVSVPSMHATIRRLEQDGRIERASPTGRGNTARLRVTEKGRQAVADARERAAELDELLLGALPAETRKTLVSVLRRTAEEINGRARDA
ncbi:MarR family winged helix-turn-helix transcriptional regulator [Streptomyces sp. NPDC058576]|uniref:MarR family winged helix-turn-helix transcriptional regulator n=1 Tax=Streptomyces sp. NPDC058576 TaxID=3346547 RepID=UPI003659544E